MNLASPSPPPEGLSLPPEQHSKATPQQHQAPVGHDGRHVSGLHGPSGDELGEAIAPDVLVNGDGDEEGTRDGLVRVDSVRGHDGRNGSDLDAGGREADDDNHLPWPFALHA